MVTLMVFHEVDDVKHWLASPKRKELFGPLEIKVRRSGRRLRLAESRQDPVPAAITRTAV